MRRQLEGRISWSSTRRTSGASLCEAHGCDLVPWTLRPAGRTARQARMWEWHSPVWSMSIRRSLDTRQAPRGTYALAVDVVRTGYPQGRSRAIWVVRSVELLSYLAVDACPPLRYQFCASTLEHLATQLRRCSVAPATQVLPIAERNRSIYLSRRRERSWRVHR